jgi:hypothetical protein
VKLTGRKPRLAARPARLAAAPKKALPFYLKPEWRALVARLIVMRGRKCEKCGAEGVRIYGDHVVELKDGGAELDANNVELLCSPCHGKKTARAKVERAGLA